MSILNPTVEYRPIPGYPGYSVGEDGTVVSYWRATGNSRGNFVEGGGGQFISDIPQRLLKHKIGKPNERYPHRLPYHSVRLKCNGESWHAPVHTLVLLAFSGPRPEGMQARHLDGNVQNNLRGNLCWGTALENHADKIRHGTTTLGERSPRTNLTNEDIREIRRLKAIRVPRRIPRREIAARFNITVDCLDHICYGDNWRHVQ